ncbi:MAG: zinc ribbon domain-containing protein, partial [Candidatus Nealsonbacteria bacterium]
PKSHTFAYRGLIRCAECGAMITAEDKIKRQKNGNVHKYIYYHCTKRINPNCSQKCTEEKELEKQIIQTLDKIEIPPEFHKWAMEWFKEQNKYEAEDRNKILENQQKEYEKCIKKIDTLIDMRASEEITEQEFINKKSELSKEKLKLQELLNDTDNRVDSWLNKTEECFNFARDAKKSFENGDLSKKKEILSALGSNLLLKDKILSISIEKPLFQIEKVAFQVKRINERLEPLKIGENKGKMDEIWRKSSVMLRG